MTSGGVLLLVFLLALGALSVTTLVMAVRGGRGPGDPPASHLRVDPAGFPVVRAPHGAFERRSRATGRPVAARIAAAVRASGRLS
jgi:hypothetical protein